MPTKEIIVYGTSWCPDSRRAQKAFRTKGVKYTWVDINKDKAGRAYVEKVNHGMRSVPTILFPDGSMMVEPSTAELQNKLNELS
jgi:mycoredoxin